jgi:hypothetical protein
VKGFGCSIFCFIGFFITDLSMKNIIPFPAPATAGVVPPAPAQAAGFEKPENQKTTDDHG